MSGTSMDGIDTVLVSFPEGHHTPLMIGSFFQAYPEALKKRILHLCQSGPHELAELCKLDVCMGELFAASIAELLARHGYAAADIEAIGSHGQTILHHSGDATGKYSLQIGDPNTIAYCTRITTVADFRRMDIAAHGQGAPLAPAFHEAMFRDATENRVIVNIGGMANITVLPSSPSATTIGFDTGPGNVLMDAWAHRHTGRAFDQGGAWASAGKVDQPLLDHWLEHPYFAQRPPKSTGREMFDLAWLDETLANIDHSDHPADVQRTLTELTARTISDSIHALPTRTNTILVCGGGYHNTLLMQRLADMNPTARVSSTLDAGVDPDWLEAIAFAWLAKQRIDQRPGNIPSVTGSEASCVLGGIYAPPLR